MTSFAKWLLLSAASAFPFQSALQRPDLDSFYGEPSNLDSMYNGEVYDWRSVPSALLVELTGAYVEQVAYKTTNTQNMSSHSVATVFIPRNPDPYARILSYQIYEDSANIGCSPSFLLATSPTGITTGSDVIISIVTALKKGWYVIVPDHEGPRSGFIAGHEQGRAGLDGIKAGINYLGLAPDTPVAMLGYSGGASATAWMASLQEAYAPSLNIVGAAYGGTPVDLKTTVEHLDDASNLFSAFIVPSLSGLLSSYPDVQAQVWPHMYPEAQNAITSARKPNFCLFDSVITFEHQTWRSMLDVDPFTFPPFAEVFQNESLLMTVSPTPVPVPKFPRYIWHAQTDQVIPWAPVDQYVHEQCSHGANIQYVVWQGDDHISAEYLGLPDALQFIIQALEFRTPYVPCGTSNGDTLTLVSTTLGDRLGQVIADLLKALSEVTSPLGNVVLSITNGYQPNKTVK